MDGDNRSNEQERDAKRRKDPSGEFSEWPEDGFDPEEYFAREDGEEEEEDSEPPPRRKWVKRVIATLLSLMLLGNVLAFWPQVFTLDALRFIAKSRELSRNEQIQDYKQAVAVVKAGDRKGTGFTISADGTVLTNYHVVEGESELLVHYPGGATYRSELAAGYPDLDLAVLRLVGDGLELPVLKLDEAPAWDAGQPVYVIGNPLFFNRIANEGRIAGLTPLDGWSIPVMLLDAPIYRGNSGSPVISGEGKVIAVVFATVNRKHGGETRKFGLAVPIEALPGH